MERGTAFLPLTLAFALAILMMASVSASAETRTLKLHFTHTNERAEITFKRNGRYIKEGLDKIFLEAGFEWREPGCSMCLAMNADKLAPGERCASTSNRNFEGRQGRGGRTHLVSPAMAAAAAIAGHFVDVREFKN